MSRCLPCPRSWVRAMRGRCLVGLWSYSFKEKGKIKDIKLNRWLLCSSLSLSLSLFQLIYLFFQVRRIWRRFCGHAGRDVLLCPSRHSGQKLHCSSGCYWYYPTLHGLGTRWFVPPTRLWCFQEVFLPPTLPQIKKKNY